MTPIQRSPYFGAAKSPGVMKRLVQQPIMRLVTGLTSLLPMGLAPLPAAAETSQSPYRMQVGYPHLRSTPSNYLSDSYNWVAAGELRKITLKSDLAEISPQLVTMAKLKADCDSPANAASKKAWLNHALGQQKVFSTTYRDAFAQVTTMENQMDKALRSNLEENALKAEIKLLADLKAASITLSPEMETESTQQLVTQSQLLEKAKDAREKATRRRRQWLDWTYHHGMLDGQHKKTYQEAVTGYRSALQSFIQADVAYNAALAKQKLVQQLRAIPKEQLEATLATLQGDRATQLATTAPDNAALSQEVKTPAFTELYGKLIPFRDSMIQLAANPSGYLQAGAIKLSEWEYERVSQGLELTVSNLVEMKKYYESMLQKLAENPEVDFRLETQKAPNPWPKNFMVGSAVEQETVAWGMQYYLSNLLEESPKHGSLPAAMVNQAKKGMQHQVFENQTFNENGWLKTYRINRGTRIQIPHVSTQVVDGWKVADKDKTRHLIIIQGEDGSNFAEGAMLGSANWAKAEISKCFNVKAENAHVLSLPDLKTIEAKFDDLSKVAGKGSEVMVVVVGHGMASNYDAEGKMPDWFKEGGYNGFMNIKNDEFGYSEARLTEDFVKEQARKLKDCDAGIVLVLSCHSGSWIAHNQPAALPANPFNLPRKDKGIA